MSLVAYAEKYCSERNINRGPVHSAARFVRVVGDLEPEEITDATMRQFRLLSEAQKFGAWTIRDTLKDVRTLVKAAGYSVAIDRVRAPEPNPQPVSFDTIDLIWPHLAAWSRQWMVVSYWTCLRIADSIRLQRDLQPDKLQWKARKTGHNHKWPVTDWLKPFVQPVKLPYSASDDWSKVIVRAELDRVCALAGCPRILPSQVRDTGLQEWCRADFYVGQVVHGCKLGVIGHYVDLLGILEPVAPRVRLPACFGADTAQQPESELIALYRSLDPQAKDLVRMTARRMAR